MSVHRRRVERKYALQRSCGSSTEINAHGVRWPRDDPPWLPAEPGTTGRKTYDFRQLQRRIRSTDKRPTSRLPDDLAMA
jgi:hypothetical protein